METTGVVIPLPWQGIGLTDTGLVRTSNQDAFALQNHLGLWAIADGMGGHAGGSLASQIAVESTVDHIRSAYESLSNAENQSATAIRLLMEATQNGHAAIRQRASANPDLTGMGTTVVIALYCPARSQVAVAHVGDSRAYLIRNGSLRLLTADHSLVQRLVAEGQITAEEALTHPQQNILLRALGADDQAAPDIHLHTLEREDMILLCTDGLTKTTPEEQILATILANRMTPLKACQDLIELANTHGGKDNTTVVLISPSYQPIDRAGV